MTYTFNLIITKRKAMKQDKLPYAAPAIQTYGKLTEITGTGCFDLGISDTKNVGYPSDQNWKFIPICDAPSVS
jgi:hypothetical protein